MTKPIFRQNYKRKFYVYAIQVDGIARYIGKGSNGRHLHHMKIVRALERGTRMKATIPQWNLYKAHIAGASIKSLIVESGLTERQAHAAEVLTVASAFDVLAIL